MIEIKCDRCNAFITKSTPEAAGRLGDKIICKACGDLGRETLDKLEAVYKKLVNQLAAKHNRAVVELEEVIHQMVDE